MLLTDIHTGMKTPIIFLHSSSYSSTLSPPPPPPLPSLIFFSFVLSSISSSSSSPSFYTPFLLPFHLNLYFSHPLPFIIVFSPAHHHCHSPSPSLHNHHHHHLYHHTATFLHHPSFPSHVSSKLKGLNAGGHKQDFKQEQIFFFFNSQNKSR